MKKKPEAASEQAAVVASSNGHSKKVAYKIIAEIVSDDKGIMQTHYVLGTETGLKGCHIRNMQYPENWRLISSLGEFVEEVTRVMPNEKGEVIRNARSDEKFVARMASEPNSESPKLDVKCNGLPCFRTHLKELDFFNTGTMEISYSQQEKTEPELEQDLVSVDA